MPLRTNRSTEPKGPDDPPLIDHKRCRLRLPTGCQTCCSARPYPKPVALLSSAKRCTWHSSRSPRIEFREATALHRGSSIRGSCGRRHDVRGQRRLQSSDQSEVTVSGPMEFQRTGSDRREQRSTPMSTAQRHPSVPSGPIARSKRLETRTRALLGPSVDARSEPLVRDRFRQ